MSINVSLRWMKANCFSPCVQKTFAIGAHLCFFSFPSDLIYSFGLITTHQWELSDSSQTSVNLTNLSCPWRFPWRPVLPVLPWTHHSLGLLHDCCFGTPFCHHFGNSFTYIFGCDFGKWVFKMFILFVGILNHLIIK